MTWDLDNLGQFYESQRSNPAEYNRLATQDPCGRMLVALRAAEQAFRDAKEERQALGTAGFSINPARTGELEGTMEAALVTRTIMIDGLESAGLALGDAVEPTAKSFKYRLDYCQRTHKTAEAGGLTALISTLEGIAASCFQ